MSERALLKGVSFGSWPGRNWERMAITTVHVPFNVDTRQLSALFIHKPRI